MRYFIMCGGVYPAWDIPKQLMKVNGEVLVYRTIRLLIEAGVDANDILITANDQRFFDMVFPVGVVKDIENDFISGKSGWWVNGFFKYPEPATYIFGDVYFSPEAIKRIVYTNTDDIAFFGSAPPYASNYIKRWGEPFAFKVWNQKRFRECIDKVKELTANGRFKRHPIAWELWQVIKGTELNIVNYNNFCDIHDYTCDIDDVNDIERLEKALYGE